MRSRRGQSIRGDRGRATWIRYPGVSQRITMQSVLQSMIHVVPFSKTFCAYAYILRRGLPSNVDVTEFFALLHRAITNRALNMALRKTIDKSLGDDLLVGPDGQCVTQFGRPALADILEHCIDTVLTDYQSLRDNMKQFQPDR